TTDKLHNLILRPVTIVATRAQRARADEAAMAAVRADAQVDVRVAGDLWVVKRLRRDERIIFRRDNQRRNRDAIDDPHRAGAVVVVLGVAEAEVRRRVDFVELAHALDRVEPRQVEPAGAALLLPPHPPLEVAHEIPLVQPVLLPLERARALADL